MTKKNKRLAALFSKHPPKDFTWNDLVAVMTAAGFSHYCRGGSHYTFEHVTGFRLCMSKTHPGGILKAYQVQNAKEALVRVNQAIED